MDLDLEILIGVWVPKGFCEEYMKEENSSPYEERRVTPFTVFGEKFIVGKEIYSDDFPDDEELMAVNFCTHSFKNAGAMDAFEFKQTLDKAYKYETKMKEKLKNILSEEVEHYVDKMKVLIWNVVQY